MSIYSRNSENNTSKYPDLIAAMPGFLQEGTKSVVLDCEAVAFDRATNKILPFQAAVPFFYPFIPWCAACARHSAPRQQSVQCCTFALQLKNLGCEAWQA